MKKYSLVIPTMWKSDLLENIISTYSSSSHIDEIILIDNQKESARPIESSKLKISSEPQNLYVNPAWNKGVSMSMSEYVIISNDDVFIENIDLVFEKISDLEFDVIFINLKDSNNDEDVLLEKITHNNIRRLRRTGHGSFFIVKKEKYIPIPEDIKIWYGDDIQFNNQEKYTISVPKVTFYTSTTISTDKAFKKLILRDKKFYKLNFLNKV